MGVGREEKSSKSSITRSVTPRLLEFLSQPLQEHSIGFLAPFVARQPEELVRRVLALVLQPKGKNNRVGAQVLQEQGIHRDRPTRSDFIGLFAVNFSKH